MKKFAKMAAVLAAMTAAGSAFADYVPPVQQAEESVVLKKIIPVDEAITIAEKQVPGSRVKDVELDSKWGKWVYELELISPDAVEHDIVLDARTGKVLSKKREWLD